MYASWKTNRNLAGQVRGVRGKRYCLHTTGIILHRHKSEVQILSSRTMRISFAAWPHSMEQSSQHTPANNDISIKLATI